MRVGRLPAIVSAWWICFLVLLACGTGRAAAPAPEFFHPPGAARGTTNGVRVSGKFEPWPPKVWVDAPGLNFLARTNQGEFQIIVAADAPPGVRLVRFFNEEGVSEPKPFVVGAGDETLEKEPNDHYAQAQRIDKLPVTVNGWLEKAGDVDCFSVGLKAGQTLEASVESIVLMSRLDAVLRVVATNGTQLAWNNDFATIDPRVSWRATNDQTVVVQVFGFPYPATSDVRLTGGDGAIYRLHLALAKPADALTNGVDTTASPPPLVELPFATRGCIREPGQLHRVRLRVTEPGWIAASIRAEALGSPLDSWLRLDDAKGKEISRNDDHEGSRDSYLEWQAATNTDYTLVVGHLTIQSGEDFLFEFSIHRTDPDFTAVTTASSVSIKPGATNEISVAVARLRGFTNELKLAVRKAPPGVTVEPVTAPAKDGDVKLQLIARTNAPPFQGPLQVEVHDTVTGRDRPVPFLLTGGTVNNGVPRGYRVLLADRTDDLWLTVLGPDPPKPAAKPGKTDK